MLLVQTEEWEETEMSSLKSNLIQNRITSAKRNMIYLIVKENYNKIGYEIPTPQVFEKKN